MEETKGLTPDLFRVYQKKEDEVVIPSSDKIKVSSAYPIRPGEKDCNFYLKTGDCHYGRNCRFNHPQELRDKIRMKICKHFLKGFCMLGSTCMFHHYMDGAESMCQEKLEEQRKRDIERKRKKARLRLDRMKPNVEFNDLSALRASLRELGFERIEGDGF